METPLDISALWRRLSMREVIKSLPPHTFSYSEKRSRAKLDDAVLTLPPEQRTILVRVAFDNMYGTSDTSEDEETKNEAIT